MLMWYYIKTTDKTSSSHRLNVQQYECYISQQPSHWLICEFKKLLLAKPHDAPSSPLCCLWPTRWSRFSFPSSSSPLETQRKTTHGTTSHWNLLSQLLSIITQILIIEGSEVKGCRGFWPNASFIMGSFSSSSLSSSSRGLKAYLRDTNSALHCSDKKTTNPDIVPPTSGYWLTVAIGTWWPIGWRRTRSARRRHQSTTPSSPTGTFYTKKFINLQKKMEENENLAGIPLPWIHNHSNVLTVRHLDIVKVFVDQMMKMTDAETHKCL